MPFEPGQSGNPLGRPRGSRNKSGLAVREWATGIVEDPNYQWRPQGESHLCGRQNSKEKRRLPPELAPACRQRAVTPVPVEPLGALNPLPASGRIGVYTVVVV